MLKRVVKKLRKRAKSRVRAVLQYALRKLDESEPPQGRRPGGPAKAGQSPSPTRRPAAPKIAAAHPERPMRVNLDADAPVDIGCVKVFRAENFPNAGPVPWLDRPSAASSVKAREASGQLSAADAAMCLKWIDDGYLVLQRGIATDVVDQAWSAYEEHVKRGAIRLEHEPASPDDPYPGRFLNPHFQVKELDQLLKHPALLRTCELLLGRVPIPFQTITSHKGSQQSAHSDSIHMTTYPLGYLVACWIAMEDIHADSGPLNYYPGSHRAPYLFSRDVGITMDDFRTKGYAPYTERYEPAVLDVLQRGAYPERFFIAKKGDVLFWHANLIHGGSRRRDLSRSRKAIVCHYYAQGCICYHDLSGSTSYVHGPVDKLPVCGATGS